MSIRKPLKERSLENCGSPGHKVLPRNKNFIEILSYYWKGSRGRWKKNSSESIKKLNQFADVLVVKKPKICTKQLKWGRKEKN